MLEDTKLPCHGKFCGRPGLPLLPLRVAYVPQGLPNLPAGIANSAYAKGVYAKFADGKPMLRVITEGYIFMHDPRDYVGWRAFQATADGRFMELTVADDERRSQHVKFSCKRGGDNLEASLINVQSPEEVKPNSDEVLGQVWIGYSRVWWTKDIRKKMLAKDGQLRHIFMVPLKVADLHNGSPPPVDIGYRVDPAGAELGKHVLEYQDLNRSALLYANTRWQAPADRSKEAAALAQHMYKHDKHGGVVLGLPDPVGLAGDTAQWRNIRAGELVHFQTAETKMRDRMVGDLILGIQKSMTDKGQVKQWNKRFAPKIDMDKVKSDKAAYDKEVASRSKLIDRASADWLSIANWDAFCLIWQVYDRTDQQCGLELERHFADCVEGSGAVKNEQKWWDPWLTAAPDDDTHPLWRAMTAGDDEVIAYLKEHIREGVDTVHEAHEAREKGEKAFDKAKEKGHEALHDFKKWLAKQWPKTRKATEASARLGNVVASQLPRLITTNAQQVGTIGARLRVIVAVRTDVVIAPYTAEVSVQELVGMMYETCWGPPTAKMSVQFLEARRAVITQDIDGAFVEGRFTSAKLLALDLWLPEKDIRPALVAPATRLALPAPPAQLRLPGPPLNPYVAMKKYVSSAEAKFAGLAGVLAMCNLVLSLKSLHEALNGEGPEASEKLKESAYGVVSGVLGVGAAIGEITSAVIVRQVTAAVVPEVAKNLAARAAYSGLLGGVAGAAVAWTESVQDFTKFLKLGKEGDLDAADNYGAASAFMLVAGVASAATSIISAGAALGAAGATGTLASTIMATGTMLVGWIPVWGWIVLGIIALGIGIWLAIRAMTAKDTPLEVWLSRCYYRNAKMYQGTERVLFKNAQEEMQAFQQAVYGLQIDLEWSGRWFGGIFGGKDEIEVEVMMPGYGKDSDYAYALQAKGNTWNWSDISNKTSAFSSDPDLKPRQEYAVVSAVKPGEKLIPLDEVLEFREPLRFSQEEGVATLKGKIGVNPDYYNRARLKFEYWPDVVNRPELEMTPGANGIDFQEIKKG